MNQETRCVWVNKKLRQKYFILLSLEKDTEPKRHCIFFKDRAFYIRGWLAGGQGIRREREVDEAKLNISRFITIGRSTWHRSAKSSST
jgi:hypothetical protein